MPLGFGKSVFTNKAPAAAAANFELVSETTLASGYKPRGYAGCKFAGKDSSGDLVFAFTLRQTANSQQYAMSAKLDSSTGAVTTGTVQFLNSGQNGHSIDVATQSYGAAYKNSATLPNDFPTTSGTSNDNAGNFEIAFKAYPNNNSTPYLYGYHLKNDDLSWNLRATNTSNSGGARTDTGSVLIEQFSDNWVLCWHNSASSGARYMKKEWNGGTTMADRGGSQDISADGIPNATNINQRNAMALYTTSGMGNIFTIKEGASSTEFFLAQVGIDTTGAWAGSYASPIYTTYSNQMTAPTIARLDTQKVLHGGRHSTNFYYVCSDWTYEYSNGTTIRANGSSASNSSEYSTSLNDGCMLIDKGDVKNAAYIARLNNTANKLEMIPLSVSGTTVTAGTANEVSLTGTYSDFGVHGGIAQYHPFYVIHTHDGTDSKIIVLKYTGA